MSFANLDGVRIHYEVSGSGHPLVFVHGHALDSRMWIGQTEALARLYTVVRYDLRGHGQSDAPRSGYSRAHYAGELRALIQHLGLTRPSLVGHSLGGAIVLEYAKGHSEQIASLTLADAGLEGQVQPERFVEVVTKQKQVLRSEGVSTKFLRAALVSPLFDGVRKSADHRKLVRSMLSSWSGASWLDATVYPDPPKLHIEILPELRLPVLVVLGEHDTITFHEAAEALTRGLLVVRKAVVPEAGHLAPLENPGAFNDILTDFVGGAAGKALV